MDPYDQKQEMKDLGLHVYPGGHVSLVEEVESLYGIPVSEILCKIPSDIIIDAVHRSLEIYGVFAQNESLCD
jgi:hypothetical protein